MLWFVRHLQFEDLKNFTTNLTYTSPIYEQALLSSDADLTEKREMWHKNLKKDIYIEEAINVLSELKLKPEYILVKN